jgi:hypothetical protein
VPAIPPKRAAKANPAQPPTKRAMRRKEPTPQQPTSEPPARPNAIAGLRSQHTTTVVVSNVEMTLSSLYNLWIFY